MCKSKDIQKKEQKKAHCKYTKRSKICIIPRMRNETRGGNLLLGDTVEVNIVELEAFRISLLRELNNLMLWKGLENFFTFVLQ